MHTLAEWILVLSCLPIFGAAGYALYCYPRLSRQLQVFTWFLVLSGVIQLISSILWFCTINNMPLLHVYVAAGFSCLVWFYQTVLRKLISPAILYTILALFLLFCVYNAVFLQSLTSYNSYGRTLEAVFVIIFALSTMIVSKNEILGNTDLTAFRSVNWINAGLLIFYTSDIFLFYYGEVIMQVFPVAMNRSTYILHSFFSVIMYTCFITALWKSRTN